MKKKQLKLTSFEKRVKKRHKQQEAEYGRDEFLFGSEEDDEEEFDDSYYDEEDGYADVKEPEYQEETPPQKPLIGNTTSLIADGIIAEELSKLAGEMEGESEARTAKSKDAGQRSGSDEFEPDDDEWDDEDESYSEDEEYESEVKDSKSEKALKAEAYDSEDYDSDDHESGDGEDENFESEDEDFESEDEDFESEDEDYDDESEDEDFDSEDEEPEYLDDTEEWHKEQVAMGITSDTQDFDFYDMPAEAEAAAMAAVARMAENEEAAAMAEAELRARKKSADRRVEEPRRNGSRKKSSHGDNKKKSSHEDSKKKSSREDDKKKERSGGFLSSLSTSDKLIIITGICVLAIAIISGTIFVRAQGLQKQITSFEDVGKSASGIYIVGEEGLNSCVAARSNYVYIDEAVEEELTAIEEEPEEIIIEEKATTIVLKAASVQSDLKIKFSNKETGKLISGIPFEVTVTSDSGKEYKWTDENKDGLIYHTEVPNGTYKVAMTPLTGSEYENYTMPADVTGIKVTDKIEYKKVDVADEVKKESEVNAAAEDTEKKDTVVESVLTDTVEWVESTKTLVSGSEDGYSKIDKSSIVIPTASIVYPWKDRIKTSAFIYDIPYMAAEANDIDITPLATEGENGDNSENTEAGTEQGNEENKENNNEEGTKEVIEVIQTEDSVSSVSLSSDSLTLKVGDFASLYATVTRADGTERGSVTWSSSDSGVASVSGGNINAISAGTAQITATSDDDSSISAVCIVKVTAEEIKEEDKDTEKDKEKEKEEKTNNSDNTTPLKDGNGNQVYVKDESSGGYMAATVADLDKYSDFYIKSDASAVYIYTGWQTIDGNTYFFDKNGNYVTGEQVIQGVKYTFNSDGHLSTGSGTMGIDVSKWNGSIDWNAVKNSGVSWVIIRCGYRGSSTGALIEDPKFRANISGAKAAGLQVGAYFFTQAVNEVEAVEEASMAVGLCGAYGLNLPLFLDVEGAGGRADSIGADMRTAVVKAFCQTVRNSGYAAGIYANKTWFTEKMHVSQLTSYKIWLAQYAAAPTYSASRIDYWQYSSKGKVSGISGNVDMNVKY